MTDVINLEAKLASFNTHWDPKIVGELNGQQVRLAKFQGEFIWHAHENEDELFLVLSGSFDMHFPDRIETVNEGEFIIVPRGVQHCPCAKEEVHVLLFEPAETLNTGNTGGPRTLTDLEQI